MCRMQINGRFGRWDDLHAFIEAMHAKVSSLLPDLAWLVACNAN